MSQKNFRICGRAMRQPAPTPARSRARCMRASCRSAANVARIDAMWSDCRARFGHGGPFLFGRFTAADAMYAPVVSRFHTYGVEVGAVSGAYMRAVMALPAWQEWYAAALKEEWLL